MKILKRYILEVCFILSFALPFIKGVNADNGRRFVETYYGFTFLMEHAILTAVFICYRGLFIPHVTRRFNPTLDKFGNPDTNLSVGLLSKHLVGNFVDNKAFEGKEIKMCQTIDYEISSPTCFVIRL